jgi:hypothetical protein
MSSRGSLLKQEAVEHPLVYGDFGGRVRKPIDYVRHYMPDMRASLESGDLIMVTDQNGGITFYIIDPRTKPVYMPKRSILMATKWTSPMPVLIGNVVPTAAQFEVTEMGMSYGELGIWKVYADNGGFQFTIDQPSFSNPVFTDGTRSIWMDYENTGSHAKKKEWSRVPEIVTFEQETPVFINAIPSNMNMTSFFGSIAYEGYRYKLIKTLVPDAADEPRVVLTVQLGALK